MLIEHQLSNASGFSLTECHFLGHRYDANFGMVNDSTESWVLETTSTSVVGRVPQPGFHTDVWHAPSGRAYVSWLGGAMFIVASPHEDREVRVTQHDLPAAFAGVWGLHDEFVIAWGEYGNDNRMFRWEGSRWIEMPSPGLVNGVHGLAPDFIYAVGAQGLIARWDGTQWNEVPSPTQSMLSRVFVVDENEMYAVGPGHSLLHGSIYGWAEVLVAPWQLHCVAKYADEIWVGAGYDGLHKLRANRLEPVDPKLEAFRFDARKNLIISTPTAIHETTDGTKFRALQVGGFDALVARHDPIWSRI